MQRARLQAQADTRRRIWEHGIAARAPTAIAAATLLRGMHAVGNNAKTSLLATLVLFKVPPPPAPRLVFDWHGWRRHCAAAAHAIRHA